MQRCDDILAAVKAFSAQKEAQCRSKREREDELKQQEREKARQQIKGLSRSLCSGNTTVNKKWRQTTVEECAGAAELELAQQAVARMFYRAAIPFKAVTYPDVIDAFDAVCAYGSSTGFATFLMPTIPSLRGKRLDDEVERIG